MIELLQQLSAAWAADTSANAAEWTAQNPSLGQCAVTALVVQDFVGGELLRGEYDGGSHYWNRLASGAEVDLTIQQFAERPNLRNVQTRPRSYLLSSANTADRYGRLRARINGT